MIKTPDYYKKVPTVLERLAPHVQALSEVMNAVKYFSRAGVKATSETDFAKDFAKGMHYVQMLMAQGIDNEEKIRLLLYGSQLGVKLEGQQLELFSEELQKVDQEIIAKL